MKFIRTEEENIQKMFPTTVQVGSDIFFNEGGGVISEVSLPNIIPCALYKGKWYSAYPSSGADKGNYSMYLKYGNNEITNYWKHDKMSLDQGEYNIAQNTGRFILLNRTREDLKSVFDDLEIKNDITGLEGTITYENLYVYLTTDTTSRYLTAPGTYSWDFEILREYNESGEEYYKCYIRHYKLSDDSLVFMYKYSHDNDYQFIQLSYPSSIDGVTEINEKFAEISIEFPYTNPIMSEPA